MVAIIILYTVNLIFYSLTTNILLFSGVGVGGEEGGGVQQRPW